MIWEGTLDPQSLALLKQKQLAQGVSPQTVDPALADRITTVQTRAPWLTPETTLSLAKGFASNEAIDAVGVMAGKRKIDEGPTQSNIMASTLGGVGNSVKFVTNALGFGTKWLSKGIGLIPGALNTISTAGDLGYAAVNLSAVRTASRYGMAALDIIPELTNQAASMIAKPILHTTTSTTPGGFWDSTSLGQLLHNPDQQGSGFFISEDLRSQQAAAARAYRGEIYGSAFTIGRGTASLIFKPNSQMYANVSGIIDAIVQIKLPDPSRLIGTIGMDIGFGERSYHVKGLWDLMKSIEGEVPLVSKAGRPVIEKVTKVGTQYQGMGKVDAIESKLHDIRNGVAGAELGLSNSLSGGDVDLNKFVKFMREKPSAQRLTKRLIKEENALKIHESIFAGDITTDMAYDLARAKTEDQVHGILSGAYGYGTATPSQRLSDYAGMFGTRVPFPSQILKKTRLFSEVPEALIVTAGDELDNTKAVTNLVLSMRASAVPNDVIDAMGNDLVKAFRVNGSSSTAVHDQLNAYQQVVRETMKANKIDNVVIEEVLKGHKATLDQTKSYFKNRMGVPTDNGLLHTQLDIVKDYLPVDEYNTTLKNLSTSGGGWGNDVALGGAIQYADMVSRTYMLPDPRRLRRLTRNSLFTDLLTKLPFGEEGVAAVGKMPILGKRALREVTQIDNKPAYDAIQNEIKAIKDSFNSSVLPHAKLQQIRDLTAKAEELTSIVEKKVFTGEQRVLSHAVEYIQNGVWKPATLMTAGYTMRNMIDAQVRMAMGGYDSAINHPLQYMALLMGKKSGRIGKGMGRGLLGEDLLAAGALKDPESSINAMLKLKGDFKNGLLGSSRIRGIGSSDIGDHMFKTNSWVNVTRGDPGQGLVQHTDGIIQQSRKIHNDPAQRAAAIGLALGEDSSAVINRVVKAIRNEDMGVVYKDIEALYRRGIEYIDPQSGISMRFPSVDFKGMKRKDVDMLLEAHARNIIVENVKTHGGNIPELHYMQAFDHVPKLDSMGKMERVVMDQGLLTDVKGNKFLDTVQAGSKVLMDDKKTIGWVISTETIGNKNILTIVPSVEEGVLTGFQKGSRGARSIVRKQGLYDPALDKGLPSSVTREINGSLPSDLSHISAIQQGMDKATNWFFNSLNERETRFLERSPVFRQSYYKHVSEHVNKLSSSEAKNMLSEIGSAAKKEGKSVGQYIGNESIAKKIEKIAQKTNHKGTLTVQELDDYAKFRGLSDTQNLLFDASKSNNLTDIARVIVPFGGAWSEVIGTYLNKAMYDNVHMYRQFSRVYNGLRNADPDQDGRGFFFKDPQSGKPMFMFPGSAELANIFTKGSFGAPLSAPVQRLSQGINVFPGVGPMMQLGLSEVVPDKPQNDTIMNLLLPYGRNTDITSALNPTPGWARKTVEALAGDTNNLAGGFANTYLETVKAESSSGDYDLSQVDEKERLLANARHKAKWLHGLRAISQFLGPTSGAIDFKVNTNQGDQYVREMAAEFSKLQSDDYDSAVDRFLKLHGNNAALYVSAKSRLAEGVTGLETTTEFGAWERMNRELVSSYSRTANYFAPAGDGFDFNTLRRQVKSGQRELLSDKALINLAQDRIGSSRYRAARVAIGAYPTEAQAKRLSDYRLELSKEYPGFLPKAQFTVNVFDNDVAELKNIIKDPRVADNTLTPALSEYLKMRDSAIAIHGGKGLTSKAASRSRQQLWEAGQALAARNPEFDRIWQRLLIKEVED